MLKLQCIFALFIVCFWALKECLDPEKVTHDFRLHHLSSISFLAAQNIILTLRKHFLLLFFTVIQH